MAFCSGKVIEQLPTLLALAVPLYQGVAEGVAMYLTGTIRQSREPEWTFFAINVPYWLLIAGVAFARPFSGNFVAWVLVVTGTLLAIVGIGLRTTCHFFLGRRFSPFVQLQPVHELLATGPYRRVRHPMYLGTLLIFLGLVLILPNWWSLAMSVLALLGVRARIHREERLLAAGVGGYCEYQQNTWRLIPGVW